MKTYQQDEAEVQDPVVIGEPTCSAKQRVCMVVYSVNGCNKSCLLIHLYLASVISLLSVIPSFIINSSDIPAFIHL